MAWDWDDLAGIGAAILTGDPILQGAAIAHATEKQKSKGAAQPPATPAPGPRTQAPAETGAVAVKGCCRYQLEGNFLLDTETGRVWVYDGAKKFEIVEKEKTALEKSWEGIFAGKLVADAVQAMDETTKASSRAEHLRVSGLIDNHVKLLDKHLKDVAKG